MNKNKKNKKLPSFIDPKTGLRYDNPDMIVPTTGKPVWQLTPDEYVEALVYPKSDGHYAAIRNYFDKIGWPEGFNYVTFNEDYARGTAYGVEVRRAYEAGKKIPQYVLDFCPGIRELIQQAKCG
jgi:hypothetical protein